jgi:hypothetical protein
VTKLEVARDEVKRIDAAMAELTLERKFWAAVVERESLSPSSRLSNLEALAEATSDAAADEYGAKTNALRRFLVGKPEGVTMRDLRTEAKKHSSTDNFPYRFVDRMESAGELIKNGGMLFATPKMQEVLEG